MKAKELSEKELESICGGLRDRQEPAPGGVIEINLMHWVLGVQLPTPYQIKK